MAKRTHFRRWRELSVPRRVLRTVLCVLLAVLIAALAYVAYVFIDYYRIEDNVTLSVEGSMTDADPARVG